MSDTASSSRTPKPSPVRGDSVRQSAEQVTGPGGDEQPTVISRHPPVPASQLSDSACRILQGKILPGDRLGHFELVQYVGGGGMGRVFRGVDSRLQRTVALKVLSPEQASDEETLLRFQNEAQSVARLDHENIARVYHVGEDRGLHYIVFEFIEGVNIRTLVERNGELPLAEAVSYTLQAAEALAHADARNVVHRDIKPSNLLITPEGQVKLIDMGLARLRHLDRSKADLTASGVTLGTFDYIAPEQARDPRNADVRSDIYSLGCTFFYMLAGRPPFPEGTVLQKLLQHQGDQPPDVRQFRPDLPDEAAHILKRMLAKDPRHRYRDSAELVDELTLLAYRIGLRPASRHGKGLPAPWRRTTALLQRHLPWIAPVTALVCVAIGLHFVDPSQWPWREPPPTAQGSNPQVPPVAPSRQGPKIPDNIQAVPDGAAGSPSHQAPGGPSGASTGGQHAPQPVSPPDGPPAGPEKLEPGSRLSTDSPGGGALRFDAAGAGLTLADETSNLLSVVSGTGAVSGHLTGAAAPAESNDVARPPSPTPGRTGLLIVSDHAQGENEFPTLQAACREAVTGDVIELRYNGRREQQPITLAKPRLTIRAGKDYRPVVVFQPDQIDPVKYPRSMFTIAAGRLTLVDLALELQVPRQVLPASWSLFEIQGGQTIRLEKCSLSIRNASDQLAAYHPDVAFFRTRSVPDSGMVTAEHGLAVTLPATIDLVDCIARGEAVFLCATDLQPVHLFWENGLLVTTEQLLQAHGGWEAPQVGEMLLIDVRHLTAVVRGGFCRLIQTVATPHLPDTQIYCADSILMAASGAPLIDQEGVDSLDDLRRQIAWNGDRNFYERFDVFWKVRDPEQAIPYEPMTFAAWQEYWGSEEESLAQAGRVVWKKLPDPGRALHTHLVAHYALDDSTDGDPNPARDAGFRAARLPRWSAGPTVEDPPPEASR